MSSFPPLQIPGEENSGHKSRKPFPLQKCARVGFTSRRSKHVVDIVESLYCVRKTMRIQWPRGEGSDYIELICGPGCGRDRVEQTLLSGWASDPVHTNSHIYAKMALNLMEKLAPSPNKPGQPEGQRKQKRSDSESLSGSVAGSGNRNTVQQSGSRGRGGRGGNGRGGRVPDAHSNQGNTHFSDNYMGRGRGYYPGPASGGRQYGGHQGGGYPDHMRGQARGRRWPR